MTYPELMEILEELLNYHADHDDGVTADALWVAIDIVQVVEAQDSRVSNLLQYLEEKDRLSECPSCGEECEEDPCEWCGHSKEI